MDIVFISDFFLEDLSGGAELVDSELIKYLELKGHSLQKHRSFETEKIKSTFGKVDCYIVSNFVGLNQEVKDQLKKFKYFIYEHDHKYLTTRDPTVFEDNIAPLEEIINKEFYESAQKVMCQSSKQKQVIEKNLQISNVISLGCSLWSDHDLLILEQNLLNEKTDETAILKSDNQIKGQYEAEQYCKKNKIKYDLVGDLSYGEFIEQLSKYSKLVFLPGVLESFSRLAIEARILNCQLITNNNLGCTSEDWFGKYKGPELLEFIRNKQSETLEKINSFLLESTENITPTSSITVILNAYRRPYNLEMQIKAIREQTVQPLQIWLWVNDHEDNRGFDYDSLEVDRVFKNDYNWKFYGRFAAALLADTEYVAIFDDDTIPGLKWFDNCLKTMKEKEGILGSAGVILNDSIYMHHNRCGWPTQNTETARVDLVGHAWFFKRDWLQYLWREKPTTWDNGEDIQFSYLAQKYGKIKTYCPPHPPHDKALHGSILGNELGIDDKATSTNSAVSHEQFFGERDLCVQTALKGGWRTVKEIKL